MKKVKYAPESCYAFAKDIFDKHITGEEESALAEGVIDFIIEKENHLYHISQYGKKSAYPQQGRRKNLYILTERIRIDSFCSSNENRKGR